MAKITSVAVLFAFSAGGMRAQEAVLLPSTTPNNVAIKEGFNFVTDGPRGPGWTRPDEIARSYIHEDLPALFQRTILLHDPLSPGAKLSWIFTGPHAGFTVELTPTSIRLYERYYESTADYVSGSYPEKITKDLDRTYVGTVQTVTVTVDAHLSVSVCVNGRPLLVAPITFDVVRHQLMFTGPRNKHITMKVSLLEDVRKSAAVQVFPGAKHQTVLGFGGSPSIPAYRQLSEDGKVQYWQLLKRYNLLIDREYPMGTELKRDLSNIEDIRDATPHYYGDNFPNGEVSDFEYSRKTRELGGGVIYEMWALPSWTMQAYDKAGHQLIDAWGEDVKVAAKPEEYARIVITYCQMAKERTGFAPEIIGIQNEVEQPQEIFSSMTVVLRKALNDAGFTSTRIHMADASFLWMALDRIRKARKDPRQWQATDYTAAHQYDFQQFFANPDLYDQRLKELKELSGDKPFLATEICLNNPNFQESSYRLALQLAQLYQKDLAEADAEMLLYCWLILDIEQPNFGASRSLLIPDRSRGNLPVASSFQLRTMGAFSRHVLKGMRRLETSSNSADLLTVAFSSDGKNTLVLLNRSTSIQTVTIDWPSIHWNDVEHTNFYSENTVKRYKPGKIEIMPGEILTMSDFHVD